jgi:hypothetical protein
VASRIRLVLRYVTLHHLDLDILANKKPDCFYEKRVLNRRLDKSCEIPFKTDYMQILTDLLPSYTNYDGSFLDYNLYH